MENKYFKNKGFFQETLDSLDKFSQNAAKIDRVTDFVSNLIPNYKSLVREGVSKNYDSLKKNPDLLKDKSNIEDLIAKYRYGMDPNSEDYNSQKEFHAEMVKLHEQSDIYSNERYKEDLFNNNLMDEEQSLSKDVDSLYSSSGGSLAEISSSLVIKYGNQAKNLVESRSKEVNLSDSSHRKFMRGLEDTIKAKKLLNEIDYLMNAEKSIINSLKIKKNKFLIKPYLKNKNITGDMRYSIKKSLFKEDVKNVK